jgi:hypothetical protein
LELNGQIEFLYLKGLRHKLLTASAEVMIPRRAAIGLVVKIPGRGVGQYLAPPCIAKKCCPCMARALIDMQQKWKEVSRHVITTPYIST